MLRITALSALLIAGGLFAWAQAKSTGCFCTDCACTNCRGGCADEQAVRACCRQKPHAAASADGCFCAQCQCNDCQGDCAEQAQK